MTNYTIDAKGKKLGRVASEAAVLLMGKKLPNFAKNTVANVKVEIVNASKIDLDSKKIIEKDYVSYSGYPGGLKHRSLKHILDNKGYGEAFRLAIRGMLPGNRLRPHILKNLEVQE